MEEKEEKNSEEKQKKKFDLKKLLLLLVFFICISVHPIKLLENSILKNVSLAVEITNNKPSRYAQSESIRTVYRDDTGRLYEVAFRPNEQNFPAEWILSYEEILSFQAELANGSGKQKNLLIAEMRAITNRNYEKRYRDQKQTNVPASLSDLARNDSTITQNEILNSNEAENIWKSLYRLDSEGKYLEIDRNTETITAKANVFTRGVTYARTKSLALYRRNAVLQTVENGKIQLGEAYLMASTRNQSSFDVDRIQQALWIVNGQSNVNSVENLPARYKGINPEASIVGESVLREAKSINDYGREMETFKRTHVIDGVPTELYDNMQKPCNELGNYYEAGMAGLVAYDEGTEEFVVGPFSVDYIRKVYIPEKGGQNENQNKEGYILVSSIIGAELYGIDKNNNEIKLNDWQFIYPNVELNMDTETAVRIAEKQAFENGDTVANIYPYPNEVFYISFKNSDIEAITKLEFTMKNINAEAQVWLYEGMTYDVDWKADSTTSLKMTPSWSDIKAGRNGTRVANLYAIQAARIFWEEKTIKLSLGAYHEKYNDYCVPLTMELAGNVWYDGTEVEQARNRAKVFGVFDKDKNGNYTEQGIPDVVVNLYKQKNNGGSEFVASTKTNNDGYYKFEYVKIGSKYYIEFEYDGMRYKATTYLKGAEDNIEYRRPETFEYYLDGSHAQEVPAERKAFNDSFTEIKNGTSRTTGQKVSDKGVLADINYEVENYDKEYMGGKANIERCAFSSRTSTTYLLYPLQDEYIITSKNISEVDGSQRYLYEADVRNIFVLGNYNDYKNGNYIVYTKQGSRNGGIPAENNFETRSTVKYVMVDEYLHHINIGLIERAPIDLALKFDMVSTNFTLLNNVSNTNIADFNRRDFDETRFDIESRKNIDENKYFEENYIQEVGYDEYIAKNDFTDNPYSLENDNLQLFVKYKLTVRNQSEITSGYVTELVNYYDEDLYYPVGDTNTADEETNEIWRYYDKERDRVSQEGYERNERMGYGNLTIPQITSYASWAIKNSDSVNKEDLGQVVWNSNSKFFSNNRNMTGTGLNAMYTNSLENCLLAPGETVDIYIVYKVELKENASIPEGYGLYISNDNAGNGKRNLVEINSYKSLNYFGDPNGGRVDIDSAPGNTEIIQGNDHEKGNYISYEDNADEAPYFRVLVNGKTQGKSITGYVWEDLKNEILPNNQKEGNGFIDVDVNKEKYINNVEVELIRLEFNQLTGEYEEVSFTEKAKDALDLESTRFVTWTGPYYGGETASKPIQQGQYRFDNLIEGCKYKIRINYGNEKQLRAEFLSNGTIYNGNDYRSTVCRGRVDVPSLSELSLDISVVVDNYNIDSSTDSIIRLLKKIEDDLKNENGNIGNMNIYTFGKDEYGIRETFDEIPNGERPGVPYSAYQAVPMAGEALNESGSKTRIMIIYNDGKEENIEDTKFHIQNLLKEGITVIGIGKDASSLEMFRTSYEHNGEEEKVIVFTLDTVKSNDVTEVILDKFIDDYYFVENISHCIDWIQDTDYKTMSGTDRNVKGRLEVMQYSQEMNAIIADSLNIGYMKTLTRDFSEGSELSLAIGKLAGNTEMFAESYTLNMNFDDEENVEKILNLGLQEIPKRTIEVTNEIDNIRITLSDGDTLIDTRNGKIRNVQEVSDSTYIYMDEEIMQGAQIEVTYRINISNIGEVDNLYSYVRYATDREKRAWYTAVTGLPISDIIDINTTLLKTEGIKISKVYSYYDNLTFRAEDNNRWNVYNRTVATDGEDDSVKRDILDHLIYANEISNSCLRNDTLTWSEVQKDDIEALERNEEMVKKYKVVEAQSLKEIEIYPNSSKEVIVNLNNNNPSKPVSTLCTYLTLSKNLSAKDFKNKDILNYVNFVELVNTSSNTGRRDYNGAECNFAGDKNLDDSELVSENDIDIAERIAILPPFGYNDFSNFVGMVIVISTMILGVGIAFIKKKIL